MLESILLATQNFCVHQIREDHSVDNEITKKRTIVAYIDIDVIDGSKHRVYVAAEPSFIQRVSKLLLEEDESDEETLIDMALETTNLIVGSAKVIAEEEAKNPYTINTPHFEKIDLFDYPYDDAKRVRVANDELIIAIKEL